MNASLIRISIPVKIKDKYPTTLSVIGTKIEIGKEATKFRLHHSSESVFDALIDLLEQNRQDPSKYLQYLGKTSNTNVEYPYQVHVANGYISGPLIPIIL